VSIDADKVSTEKRNYVHAGECGVLIEKRAL
jgi:hypothetical protein